MYRTAAPPPRYEPEITLRPNRGRQVILGTCLWALAAILLAPPAQWLVQAAVLGEDLAFVAPGLLVVGLVVAGIVQLLRHATLYISNVRLERHGFFRRSGIDWAAVTGKRIVKRRQKRGAFVHVLVVEGREGAEFECVPGIVTDPGGVLPWALDAALRGEVGSIDDRVRREGRRDARRVQYVLHGLIAVSIMAAFAWVMAPSVLRQSLGRQIAAASELPAEERLARAPELLAHPAIDRFSRCEVRRLVFDAQLELEDVAAATESCREREAAGCDGPSGGCDAFFALLRARQSVHLGAAADAVGELEALARCHTVECFSLRMQILRATGEETQAAEVGAECVGAYGHLSPDAEMLAPCRE